jgi:hypothetical protein
VADRRGRGALAEFFWFGLAVVLAARAFTQVPSALTLSLLVAAIASLQLVNGNAWALASLLVVFAAAPPVASELRLPATREFLYAYYPRTPGGYRGARLLAWFLTTHPPSGRGQPSPKPALSRGGRRPERGSAAGCRRPSSVARQSDSTAESLDLCQGGRLSWCNSGSSEVPADRDAHLSVRQRGAGAGSLARRFTLVATGP